VTQSIPPKKTATPTGFDLIEKLLGEFRDKGRSVTLETWNSEFAARLTAFKAANTSPAILKQVAQVEKAFTSANKLMEAIRPAKPAAKPKTHH